MRRFLSAMLLLSFPTIALADEPVIEIATEAPPPIASCDARSLIDDDGTAGRLLYANDDDWDWAARAQARSDARSGLESYGAMCWSALDWLTRGIPEVEGVLVGSTPYELPIEKLAKIRGERWRRVDQTPGSIVTLLSQRGAPNTIVIMRNLFGEWPEPLGVDDRAALVAFVARGGRLMVLDDMATYDEIIGDMTGVRVDAPSCTTSVTGGCGPQNGELDRAAVALGGAKVDSREISRNGQKTAGRALMWIEKLVAP